MADKPQAVKLTLNFPYKISRIRNGEKVMHPDKRGELDVGIVDALAGRSPLVALNKLFDQAEKDIRKARREAKVCNPIVHATDGSKT